VVGTTIEHWTRRAREIVNKRGLKVMLCYAWKQVWMWASNGNEAMDVYSRVMMSTNGFMS